MVECDAEVAKVHRHYGTNVFPSSIGYTAATDAIVIGGEAAVRKWYKSLEPGEKKGSASRNGQSLSKEESIQQYFLNVAENGTDEFWKSRYHQYIKDCPLESMQSVLTTQF